MEPESKERRREPGSRRGHLGRAAAIGTSVGAAAVVAVLGLQAWSGSRAFSQASCPPGLVRFEPRTPARASEINCNFSNLDQRLAAVESSVMFFTSSACPAGYVPFELAEGRYLVGAPVGGAVGATVGQALTDRENRPVGRHTHAATQAAHAHTINDPGHVHGIPTSGYDNCGTANDCGEGAGWNEDTTREVTGITINSAQPAITVEAEGAVAGTPAPYVQLRVCVRAASIGG